MLRRYTQRRKKITGENKMRRWVIALLLLAPASGFAQETGSGPLFMKDMLGDRPFFDTWGIGVDFYTMKQDYKIKELQFELPGVAIEDFSKINVRNELQHYDLKFDIWITPFLNVFALLGRVDADTYVDLSQVPVSGLPVQLGTIPVAYNGTVYGAGLNLVYGTDHWFVALNNTWTDADINGDFNSSVRTFTSQPRLGLLRNKWAFWVGGMYLDTQEKHSGSISLPIPGVPLPPVPFSVELESMAAWNYAVGVSHVFSPKATLSFEYGFGDRDHTLFNFTYRF
jgi:hypothetical protein